MDNETYIEKALRGELTAEETLVFTQKLKEDEAFAEQWAWEQRIKKAVQTEQRMAIKELLQKEELKPKVLLWPIWLAAATLIIVGIFSYYFLRNNTTDYYAAHYQKFPNLIAPNTRSDETNKPVKEAFQAYDAGEYIRAEELFDELEATEPNAGFYAAMCLLELKEYGPAAEKLSSLRFTDDFEAHRLWYLSLTHLKLGENTEAIATLEDLLLLDSPWTTQALDLLDVLKK